MKTIVGLIVFYNLIFINCFSQGDEFKYLGQTEPTDQPKVFHLPVLEGVAAERIAISSDYKEIYYTEIHPGVHTLHIVKYYRYDGSIWKGPYILFDKYNEYGPLLSRNDNILLLNGDFSVRTDTGWTAPKRFLKDRIVHYLQQTNLNNYYFLSFVNDSTTDVFKLIIHEQDTLFERQGLTMKSKVQNDYYMDPDENFILTSLNRTEIECYGGKDIFIRYKTQDGWTEPVNLGKHINTENAKTRWGMCMSPDKRYMFYSQFDESGVHIKWVKVDDLFIQLRIMQNDEKK